MGFLAPLALGTLILISLMYRHPNTMPYEQDVAFYKGQLKSTEFFVHSILPTTMGKINAILTTNGAAVEILEDSFGG